LSDDPVLDREERAGIVAVEGFDRARGRGPTPEELYDRFGLSQIRIREVEAYKDAIAAARAKARAKGKPFPDRPLSNGSINATIRTLAAILEDALDEELIASNPASGRRRRLAAGKPARPWVEPQQVPAFLRAAKTADAKASVGYVLLGLLCGTGLRIDEALSLRWRDVDLGTGRLFVERSKTAKGVRRISLPAALREVLTLWKADAEYGGDDDFVFATSSGRKPSPSNLRRDVLAPAVEAADVALAKAGIRPLGHVTFHGLRRTYASLCRYAGIDARTTSDRLGHEDIRFTFNVYSQSTLDPAEMLPAVRKAFDEGVEWVLTGTTEALPEPASSVLETKSPVSGAS
jgi:integrase